MSDRRGHTWGPLQRFYCFTLLLLVHYTTQSQGGIQANCTEDVILKCPYDDIDSMDFISVIWYKVSNEKKFGIIRKRKGDSTAPEDNTTSMSPKFGEKYSLLLFRVRPKDSGTYDCTIKANVGHQNLNSEVNLTVHECETQAVVTQVTTVWNISQSTQPMSIQVKDLPVMWSIISYVAVGLLKIILSLISIWVIHIRSSRKRQW